MQAIHDALDKYVARTSEASSGVVGAAYSHVIEEPEKLIVISWSRGTVVCVSCIACAQTDTIYGRVEPGARQRRRKLGFH
jgi:hypothetical protein